MKIETERLRIRNFKYNEASKVHQIDSNFEVMRHITEGITLPRSESEKRLLSFIDAYQTNSNMGIWLVELKEKREFIGRASLLKNDKDGFTEIGYRLLPKHWRKGYASEIITSLSHYAKVTIGLNKLHAMTYPENVASCNLLRKMNFKFINKTEVYVPIPQKYILANLYCKDL